MAEANFLRLFPEQQGYRFLLVDAPAERARPTVERAIEDALGRSRRRRDADGRAAGRVPPRREHLSLDVPDARRARPAARHRRAGRGAAAQRARAAARAGAAAARSAIGRGPPLGDGRSRRTPRCSAAGLVAGTVCALLAIAPVVWDTRRSAPVRVAGAACGERAGRRPAGVGWRHGRGPAGAADSVVAVGISACGGCDERSRGAAARGGGAPRARGESRLRRARRAEPRSSGAWGWGPTRVRKAPAAAATSGAEEQRRVGVGPHAR